MPFEKPVPKLLLRPITTGAKSAINQSEFQAITINLPEKSRILGDIGFGFACHCLKNLREILEPITMRSNRVITFDSHLKSLASETFFRRRE